MQTLQRTYPYKEGVTLNLANLQIETATLDELTPNPDNARLHDERSIAAIAASLEEFGQPEPLVIRASDGLIVGGNGRYAAMKRLGWQSCRVVRLDLDDQQTKTLALALNRTADLSYFDDARLLEQLDALKAEGFAVAETWWSQDELAALQSGIEAAPTLDTDDLASDQGDDSQVEMGKPIMLTAEQRGVFDQAANKMRSQEQTDLSDGRVAELLSAEWLSGS